MLIPEFRRSNLKSSAISIQIINAVNILVFLSSLFSIIVYIHYTFGEILKYVYFEISINKYWKIGMYITHIYIFPNICQ